MPKAPADSTDPTNSIAGASPAPSAAPSYRALLAVPSLGRVLLGMQIARIAQSMVGLIAILFALQRYDSPQLAGAVGFVFIFPGMIISPIAGARLDRHGRVRLIILDYLVAFSSLSLIAILSLAGDLPWWLLLGIAAVSSLTGPLSSSGLRSLFPLMVPEPLWERVNAVDSNGWVLASVVGAPIGALMAQVLGFEPAFLIVAAAFFIAGMVMIGAPDPRTAVITTGNLMRDAWLGLVYTWNNRTLRSLAISLSIMNLSGGMIEIVVPVLILQHLHLDQAWVGYTFGLMGAFGVVSAFLSGRLQTRGREKTLIVLPAFGYTIATILILPGAMLPMGLAWIALSASLAGLINGPMDIAMFTLRQRATDPAWMGRAFTVSMNLNFSGFPIGAALTGFRVGWSLEGAIVFGIAANLLGAILAWWLLPNSTEVAPGADEAATGGAPSEA